MIKNILQINAFNSFRMKKQIIFNESNNCGTINSKGGIRMAEILTGNNKFYIGDEQNPTAEITFQPKEGNVIVADHTYVSDELRGQGIAGKLFNKLIEYARENDLKIIPECSYVQSKMDRTNEYDDVRA